MNLHEYLNQDIIKQKYYEYSHGADYMVAFGRKVNHQGKPFISIDKSDLGHYLWLESDTFRSYLDGSSSLLVFDVEIFSKRFPNKPAEDQDYTYNKLETIDKCIMDIFAESNINPLSIATGQGYHYVCRVGHDDPEHRLLEEIGYGGIREDVEHHYSPYGRGHRRPVTPKEAAAFNGVGKLLEYLSHEVIWRAPHYGVDLPVVVGDQDCKNEDDAGINLDISCFEAPLHMRDIRCPFSSHQKMQVKYGGNRGSPIRVAIPRNIPFVCHNGGDGFKVDLQDILHKRFSYDAATELAHLVKMEIPNQASGVANLISKYKQSRLGQFHVAFDSANKHGFEADTSAIWNSNLLKPPSFRHMIGHYFSQKPFDAGFARRLAESVGVAMAYKHGEDADNPMDRFKLSKYPPQTKANFWTRVYWGMLQSGMKFM